MSGTKRMMDDVETKRARAISIGLDSGVLSVCDEHGEIFAGNRDLKAAHKAVSKRFFAGRLKGVFESLEEVEEAVKQAIEDHPSSQCPRCMGGPVKG